LTGAPPGVRPGTPASPGPNAAILVVEDEPSLAQTLAYNLEREGYAVRVAHEGYEALELFEKEAFDLVLLDVMLPGLSGFEVCREIRRHSAVPIIMLTARRDEIDKVAGLDLGADDYVTKPFGMRELVARVRAALRRATLAEGGTVSAGDITVDLGRHEAAVLGNPLPLSPKEFALLHLLTASAGAVVTRGVIMERVWGYDFAGDERTLDVHIAWLRGKLARAGSRAVISTVRGVGYRLEPRPDPEAPAG
jgi:two-component system response regulator RegX3